MNGPEYRIQTIRTHAQWESGALCKLHVEGGKVTLFSSPSFSAWIRKVDACGPAVAVDECGQIYWVRCASADRSRLEGGDCLLHVLNLDTDLHERIALLADDCRPSRTRWKARRLWVGPDMLWLFVEEITGGNKGRKRNSRFLGFSRETLQLVRSLQPRADVLDAAYDGEDFFYLLEKRQGDFAVCRYPVRSRRGCPIRCASPCPGWESPMALALSSAAIFVIDSVSQDVFFRIGLEDFECEALSWPRKRGARCEGVTDPGLGEDFRPRLFSIDRQDNLFVLSQGPGADAKLHQLDPQGGYLGEVRLPDDVESIDWMFAGPGDDFYLVTGQGLAKFNFDNVPIGESGVYYSRTLDNGEEGGSWHRLALKAALPDATALRISYFASDQAALQRSVDDVLSAPDLTNHERRQQIESRLGPHWVEAGVIRGSDAAGAEAPAARSDSPVNLTHDLLFIEKEGRYLWLKIELTSFREQARPALREIRVLYPRLSYFRYLPATYQEDPDDPSNPNPPSRHFLERFLSLFETVFWGLDIEIDRLFEFFDPRLTPDAFLPWLAGWLNLGLEEHLPENRKRELIERAYELYQLKGTPAGLAEMIRIMTGEEVIIREPAESRPAPLGGEFRIGLDTFVRRSPARGFRLGDSSLLGGAVIRRPIQLAGDPLTAAAHRFTVVAAGTEGRAGRDLLPTLRRILDEHKPAHTAYNLQRIGEGRIGAGLYLGLNTRLQELSLFRLGDDRTLLGRTFTTPATPGATSLGTDSRLTGDFELS